MRISDAPKTVTRSLDDAKALSSSEVRGLFLGFDLGFLPTKSELCSLLGRAANALAALFDDEPAPARGGGVKTKATSGASGLGSIVDFGDGKGGKGGSKSIVDFGDRPASIVDFGDGKVRTE